MKIVIAGRRRAERKLPPYPYVFLDQDNWDDFGFKCRFLAELRIAEDKTIDLGGMRIAVGDEAFRATEPTIIDRLPDDALSMGESVAYYRRLRDEAPVGVRKLYLRVVGDVIASPRRRRRLESTNIWETSFMREAASRHAVKRAGYYIGAPTEDIEPPQFTFSIRMPRAAARHVLEIDFRAAPELPNRLMLLIGRNATGKTRCLAGLVSALVPPVTLIPETRIPRAEVEHPPEISRIIAVSYNAFDEFPLPRKPAGRRLLGGIERRSRHSYKYCGLRTEGGEVRVAEVGAMLDEALEPVSESAREDVLQRVLARLIGPDLAEALTDDDRRSDALSSLSAGQRLVTAIFTNIVGFVEEGSLLLIDEPETHLHPGLLSSVAAALQDVLKEFDSYAIIATHSPFLLQQVPSPFVRVFRRIDDVPQITTLDVESFGEDLGELNRTVLGLADPERDFTHVLDGLHDEHGSADAVAELFPHSLGVLARAHLYALDQDLEEG